MAGKFGLKVLRADVLVDPLYDPETVETGLSPGAPALYVPDSFKNPMSQQGIVVAVGPDNHDVEVDDHVLYHPFVGQSIWKGEREYLLFRDTDIVGYLDPSGNLWPLPGYVVIRPIFSVAGRPAKEGSLWVPKQLIRPDIPCAGVVVNVGANTEIEIDQCVLFPPNRGNEIGLRQVFYTIRESDLLAILSETLYATAKDLPAWWQLPEQERYAHHSD